MKTVIIRQLGRQGYTKIWHAMQCFTRQRDDTTFDEIWLLEHPPIYTQGQAGKVEHVLDPKEIPVIQTDRGGHFGLAPASHSIPSGKPRASSPD